MANRRANPSVNAPGSRIVAAWAQATASHPVRRPDARPARARSAAAPRRLSVRSCHRFVVAHLTDAPRDVLHRPPPAFLAAGRLPEPISFGRIPRRHVDAVRDVPDGHLGRRPSRKERLHDSTADGAMQPADAVDRTAAANRQVGHVERLRLVIAIGPAKREQVVQGDAQFMIGVQARSFASSSGANRSNPASTAVCVVNRLPARVIVSASSKACA